MSGTMDGLAARDVRVAFGKTLALHGAGLEVAPGETLVLFCPSGAGKTVLLRAIAGLDLNSTGQVTVAGRNVSAAGPEHRSMGVAFQNFALYPHMPAYGNIASLVHARRLPAAEIKARVERIAALLKISHVLGQPPRALSNGQKQRMVLARALVGEPKILFIDDPLRNVDAKLRYEMRMELPRLLRRSSAASIHVTQDYREAMALGDRVVVLIEGRIVQTDHPEQVYDAPASNAVARLFGNPPLNLVPCRPHAGNDGVRVRALGLDIGLPVDPALAGRDSLLGLRPEDIVLFREAQPGAAPATLEVATPLHEKTMVMLRMPDGQEMLASMNGNAPAPGAAVWIQLNADRALLYDAGTGLLDRHAARAVEAAA